ncbi:hypothetical protein [Paenibacillus protaetiae]|uniref:Uncharacterized protein n=1 Tax=Paenibacillus protaetiae TaxID=2509456 RepID=A0A4P6F0T3_9BACL|nr:hypothetical protein [Paenibacillus protaetiae]QAY68223.1 hypothetical protein ET464_19430 [Paenibacillus protaetiae]
MKRKKRSRRSVVSVQAAQAANPYALTLRLSPEQSRKLFAAAAAEPEFARRLSAAIREGNLPLMRSLFRARGIRPD